jgi:hypothetical protein
VATAKQSVPETGHYGWRLQRLRLLRPATAPHPLDKDIPRWRAPGKLPLFTKIDRDLQQKVRNVGARRHRAGTHSDSECSCTCYSLLLSISTQDGGTEGRAEEILSDQSHAVACELPPHSSPANRFCTLARQPESILPGCALQRQIARRCKKDSS